jgi:hypothetical protein
MSAPSRDFFLVTRLLRMQQSGSDSDTVTVPVLCTVYLLDILVDTLSTSPVLYSKQCRVKRTYIQSEYKSPGSPSVLDRRPLAPAVLFGAFGRSNGNPLPVSARADALMIWLSRTGYCMHCTSTVTQSSKQYVISVTVQTRGSVR